MEQHQVAVEEQEISRLAIAISNACDETQPIVIMLAMVDILWSISKQSGETDMGLILSDFVGLAVQRHGGGIHETAH